jgi:hypothetical protein
MAKAICKNCGLSIVSIDGWIHDGTGRAECIIQPKPRLAEPDEEGLYCA